MDYKSLKEIPFPWDFKDLMKLPIFMIEEIYRYLDQKIEEEKQISRSDFEGVLTPPEFS